MLGPVPEMTVAVGGLLMGLKVLPKLKPPALLLGANPPVCSAAPHAGPDVLLSGFGCTADPELDPATHAATRLPSVR